MTGVVYVALRMRSREKGPTTAGTVWWGPALVHHTASWQGLWGSHRGCRDALAQAGPCRTGTARAARARGGGRRTEGVLVKQAAEACDFSAKGNPLVF